MALICVDACVFLNILHPAISRASEQDIDASQRIVDMIQEGQVDATAPAMTISEIVWVSGRLYKHEQESIFLDQLDELIAALPWFLGDYFFVVPVDSHLATEAALMRLKYYSRKKPISYNDALLLATAGIRHADYLITNDKVLLETQEEVRTLTPSQFINKL